MTAPGLSGDCRSSEPRRPRVSPWAVVACRHDQSLQRSGAALRCTSSEPTPRGHSSETSGRRSEPRDSARSARNEAVRRPGALARQDERGRTTGQVTWRSAGRAWRRGCYLKRGSEPEGGSLARAAISAEKRGQLLEQRRRTASRNGEKGDDAAGEVAIATWRRSAPSPATAARAWRRAEGSRAGKGSELGREARSTSPATAEPGEPGRREGRRHGRQDRDRNLAPIGAEPGSRGRSLAASRRIARRQGQRARPRSQVNLAGSGGARQAGTARRATARAAELVPRPGADRQLARGCGSELRPGDDGRLKARAAAPTEHGAQPSRRRPGRPLRDLSREEPCPSIGRRQRRCYGLHHAGTLGNTELCTITTSSPAR